MPKVVLGAQDTRQMRSPLLWIVLFYMGNRDQRRQTSRVTASNGEYCRGNNWVNVVIETNWQGDRALLYIVCGQGKCLREGWWGWDGKDVKEFIIWIARRTALQHLSPAHSAAGPPGSSCFRLPFPADHSLRSSPDGPVEPKSYSPTQNPPRAFPFSHTGSSPPERPSWSCSLLPHLVSCSASDCFHSSHNGYLAPAGKALSSRPSQSWFPPLSSLLPAICARVTTLFQRLSSERPSLTI